MLTKIHSYESFGAVDGPGIRFIVFFQGCSLRCAFCHNPDTWELSGGMCKQTDDIMAEILKYKTYFKNGGGITVSGGEPLLQMEALIALLTRCKEAGIHTCVDTSGIVFDTKDQAKMEQFHRLLSVCDLFLLDIKHIDPIRHKALTGMELLPVLEFARFLDQQNKPVWLRHVLVPEDSAKEVYLRRLRAFICTLSNIEKIEVLPYHTMGIVKYEKLGIPYRMRGVKPPDKEEIETAKRILMGKEREDETRN